VERHGWSRTFTGLTALYADLFGAPGPAKAVVMPLAPRLNLVAGRA
jgi:hypothetical protein